MKIMEMTATFGKLHRAVLRPGPGLTLIMAPNEGGKSTWAAFLRAMLYGFPQRDRDKAGYLAEKNRYQPWSGAAMEGTLVVEWQGRSLTLYRGPKGATAVPCLCGGAFRGLLRRVDRHRGGCSRTDRRKLRGDPFGGLPGGL